MSNLISIGVMTQAAKKSHLEVLWAALLKQHINQKIEVILFSEAGFTPLLPKELNTKFVVHPYFYQKPFNIGFVRNSIVRCAQGKYLTFLDDDVAIGPFYFQTLTDLLEAEAPAVLAGLSYHVFRRPQEFLTLFHTTSWKELITTLGRRDAYSRRIGRYDSENLTSTESGDSNWLGSIGRNMTIQRNLALRAPFVEFNTLGFQDLEFAYRLQQLGEKVVLKNNVDLACLHLFHHQNASKANDYRETFQTLVEQKKLPVTARKWFFQDSDTSH